VSDIKYNLHDYVEFYPGIDKDQTLCGEIIGIIRTEVSDSYCIYNEAYINNPLTLIMEPSDLDRFDEFSDKFVRNLGKRAYWKETQKILRVARRQDGEFCFRCKEYFQYAEPNCTHEGENIFKCFQCRQNPWR
jgi:hypothetical protein